MQALTIYFLLLKATLTSFSGMSSLPVVHSDFVRERRMLTDRDLSTAVAVARMTPGPLGLYLVCVGYQAGGWPGAVAGFLAMVTPAFFVIAILRWLGRRADNDAVKRSIRAVILAAAGLVLSATIPLALDALTGPLTILVAAAACTVLVLTRLDTVWVIAAAAAVGIATNWFPG